MQKILFIGMPGSGKGTQTELLKKYKFKHISPGDLLREGFQRKDPLILPHKKDIDSGKLFPDDLLIYLIEREIKKLKGFKGYILDGAARTLYQTKKELKKGLFNEVLNFYLTEKQAIDRLKKRRICPKCEKIYTSKEKRCKTCRLLLVKRKDDSPKAVKHRFQVYKKKTKPVLAFLKKNISNYHEIDASGTIEEINRKVKKILGLN